MTEDRVASAKSGESLIGSRSWQVDFDLIRRLSLLPTANVGDAMDRLGVVDPAIHRIGSEAHVGGPAFTVLTRPGDNLTVHRALECALPGDVLVIDGGGDTSRALIGELMVLTALRRGIAGFVIDGMVRDTQDLVRLPLPVFARGSSPAGPYKTGPGRMLVPIAIGGVCVRPGDLVLGDLDGVVVVRSEDANEVIARAETIRGEEDVKRANLLKSC